MGIVKASRTPLDRAIDPNQKLYAIFTTNLGHWRLNSRTQWTQSTKQPRTLMA